MPTEPLPPVSEAELQVLRALWQQGPSSVRELHAYLRELGHKWARTTVITLLGRLESKGYVSIDKSGHAFGYHAIVTRDQMLRLRMSELADDLCDGQWAPILLAFTEPGRLTAEDVEELQELVDDLSRQLASQRKKRR